MPPYIIGHGRSTVQRPNRESQMSNTTRRFYAFAPQGVGATIHVFTAIAARNQFVAENCTRKSLPAADVERTLRAKGQHIRFASVIDQNLHAR